MREPAAKRRKLTLTFHMLGLRRWLSRRAGISSFLTRHGFGFLERKLGALHYRDSRRQISRYQVTVVLSNSVLNRLYHDDALFRQRTNFDVFRVKC